MAVGDQKHRSIAEVCDDGEELMEFRVSEEMNFADPIFERERNSGGFRFWLKHSETRGTKSSLGWQSHGYYLL